MSHSHHHRALSEAVLIFSFLFILPRRALRAGQIVPVMDSQGQQVYINVEERRSPAPSADAFTASPSSSVPQSLRRLVKRTAGRYRVDPKLVDAVIRVESQYDPRAVSPKGAMGLMQLIPATAERFGVENPFDPRQNVRGGVSYLRYLLNLFNGNVPLSLAAYNAGENLVLHDGGIPPIPETVNYVRKVTSIYHDVRHTIAPAAATASESAPIYEYRDAEGVLHFTNDGGF